MPALDVIRLYRQFLRSSKAINDYNLSSYFLRRTRSAFKKKMDLEPLKSKAAYQFGLQELRVLKRCVTLTNLYPSEPSVMQAMPNFTYVQPVSEPLKSASC